MIDVNITGGKMSEKEREWYINHAERKFSRRKEKLTAMDIEIDGDFVDITYHLRGEPFERIRRITGYLVGTLDRFNNAKRAEESARVKHTTNAK